MKVKEESEKAGFKLNMHKTEIMTSGPITSWQRNGETMERVRDFIFLSSKITADGDCSCEVKRRLPLARKALTNLDSTLKSKNITLTTKVHLVKAMVFPVVMYGCESWTIKRLSTEELMLLNCGVGKVMYLLFNMLSRLVITFLPMSKHLNVMAAVTICNDFGAPQNKVSHSFHCFPIYFP